MHKKITLGFFLVGVYAASNAQITVLLIWEYRAVRTDVLLKVPPSEVIVGDHDCHEPNAVVCATVFGITQEEPFHTSNWSVSF